MRLMELFEPETAFPLEWDTQFANRGEVHAEALDTYGRVIHISFVPVGRNSTQELVIQVDFSRGGSFDMTGRGEAARVMSTVIKAIKIFVDKYKPKYLLFTADTSSGRSSAYSAMVRRAATGYRLLSPEEYPESLGDALDYVGTDKPFVLERQ